MHAQVHEKMGLCVMDEIIPIMLFCADRAKVPVCVHLDHGEELDYVKRALELGAVSVMYDGSMLDKQTNYTNTCTTVEMAAKYGASVEAEIGSLGAREGDAGEDESIYTEPEDARDFTENTGIDALACAFGTAHGIYLKKPKLDFCRLEKIRDMVNVPLVMHGGSGVSPEDYKRVIEIGVRKINYYTYMSKAGGTAVAELQNKTFYHDIEAAALKGMMCDACAAIEIFKK